MKGRAMVTFTLDNREVQVEEGLTVLEAARRLGVYIPTLCYHEGISPFGACRLCLVEAVGPRRSRLYTACTYPVEEGLVVRTSSSRVMEARKMMVELLLARCPNVPVIQGLARQFGIEKPAFPVEDHDCILCGLCVRVCEEVVGKSVLTFVNRGPDREVSTPYDATSEECIACGACAAVCPTGAIRIEGLDEAVMSALPLGPITSIYTPSATSVPKVPVIDPETCIHFRTGNCGICAELCERRAIDHEMQEQEIEVPVGAIVVATGFEPYDARQSEEFGFGRYPNVLSSLQYERLLMAAGPTAGTVVRPSDGRHPKRIAFFQCVGSRDQRHPYCSSVCCMFATKHAILTRDHDSTASSTIFMMDMRAFGKGFDAYYERAQADYGVRYVRCRPSSIKEVPGSRNLLVRYQADDREIVEEEFDLVVLSVGMEPAANMPALAEALGIELNEFGFCHTDKFAPLETNRPGIFACGPIVQPCDIPDSVVQGSGAAARSLELVGAARGTLAARKEYPAEVPLDGQEPRIGVFICHCGTNIAGVIDVRRVAEYAATLPNVVYATSNLYTCAQDNQEVIKQAIEEHRLNRLVVSACTPRTHEPLFQDTLREAGLNPYLFEMANIRDQCSWVH
ncbi:MAG: 2Fe-2S iron-sulfur cluster-binding protein, partial [Bacteroidetes bacterium]|nr:2Fe-2S iron-sulfur cluster-binding protein [Bacteroidota bacterium]